MNHAKTTEYEPRANPLKVAGQALALLAGRFWQDRATPKKPRENMFIGKVLRRSTIDTSPDWVVMFGVKVGYGHRLAPNLAPDGLAQVGMEWDHRALIAETPQETSPIGPGQRQAGTGQSAFRDRPARQLCEIPQACQSCF
jgi:hypothetical protein